MSFSTLKKLRVILRYALQCVLGFALYGTSVAFAALPDSVQASYDIFKSGIPIGRIEETYTRDQDRYTLSSITTPVGLLAIFKPEKIFIQSKGLINPQGLQPLLFEHKRERDDSKDNRAKFDWQDKRLTLLHHQQRDTVDLPDGTQDRLSAMYQFMFLNLQPNTSLDFPMTNGSKLDRYHYAVSGPIKLGTPAGELDTLYLDSQAKPGESRTEIWLSTQYHNLPCKMIITDSHGDQLIQVLNKFILQP